MNNFNVTKVKLEKTEKVANQHDQYRGHNCAKAVFGRYQKMKLIHIDAVINGFMNTFTCTIKNIVVEPSEFYVGLSDAGGCWDN